MELEYLRDNQGNFMIKLSGFTYIKQKQYNHSKKCIQWNCVEEHKSCKACLLTYSSKKKPPEFVNAHNHLPHSTSGKDETAFNETEPKSYKNHENISSKSVVNQEEISSIDSSENNFNFIVRSCLHNECQKQPGAASISTKLFPKYFSKELSKLQSNDTFSGIHIISQPCKSSLVSNALQNKSEKKLYPSVLKLQSFHSVSQFSCGALSIEWITHHANLKTLFPALLLDEQNVDVILATEGQSIKCHKLMLIRSSVYFEKLLNEIIEDYCFPIVAFTDWHFWQLKALVEYLYCGKVTVTDKKLEDYFSFIETLQIKGLQSWSNQMCLLNMNGHSKKQNIEGNLVNQNRLNSKTNTILEQTNDNHTPVKCQKRKRDLIENSSNIKADGVNTKFAKFISFCA